MCWTVSCAWKPDSLTRMIGLTGLCILLGACGTPTIFPPHIMKDVETETFDFKVWKEQQYYPFSADPVPRKVQLGGRIVEVDRTSAGVVILAEELPIVRHPAYGPKAVERDGSFAFAIVFNGFPESSMLQVGNRLIAVGTTEGIRGEAVDGIPRPMPHLAAQCIHLWKTQGKEIENFPYELGGTYYPLEERTFCVE